MSQSRYPYGASYSPLIFAEEEWKRDLEQMAAAGMNLVRIGDVNGSWDRIEPRPGEFEFEALARFYEATAQYDIDVMMSSGTNSPPLWLAIKYPDVSILSSTGMRYPLGASYHWACVNHPGFIEAAKHYVGELAKFASAQKNHFGWQISNEIGFPFMPARDEGRIELYCYCEHCQARFREWVKDKYQTLEAVAKAWAWSTTAFVYNDWSEIFAPEAMPSAWASVTRWIDWRLFSQQSFAEFAGWQHQLIKSIDPDHPTSLNTFNFKGFDRFGAFMGLDQWQLSEQVDHIGYDLYPGSGKKLSSRPEHNSIFLDHGRSVARQRGTDFWLHEIESGPINNWALGPDNHTGPDEIMTNGIEALGHDVKLILYMGWKEWLYQPLHWGGLVDLNSNPTEGLAAASSLGRFVQEQAETLAEAHAPMGEVAILEDKANAIFFKGIHGEEPLFAAQRGAYLAFWEQGFQVDFINAEVLASGKAMDYKAICLPLVSLVSEATAKALKAYVEQGGVVIALPRMGMQDQQGWYQRYNPHPDLRSVFRLAKIESDEARELPVTFQNVEYPAKGLRDLLTLDEGAETLATFADGRAAITLGQLGEGWGVYVAASAARQLAEDQSPLLPDLAAMLAGRFGWQPRVTIEPAEKRAKGLDPHLLMGDRQWMVLFSNYLEEAVEKTIRVEMAGKSVSRISQIYPNSAELVWEPQSNQVAIQASFGPKEVKVIQIELT